MKHHFLIVASDGQVRESLACELRAAGYSVTLAANGGEAERIARNVAIDAALIETHLGDLSADELCERLLQHRPDCHVTVVTSFEKIRNTSEQFRFGVDDYLLGNKQLYQLLRASHEVSTDGAAARFARRATSALTEVIDVLVGLRELDDRCFGGSSHQAMQLARATAVELSADEDTVHEVVLATLLRDIGNVGLERDVLDSRGDYDDGQRQQMQEHANSSVRLLEHIDFPWKILPIIRHHHECYDGSGYPDGLRGREIPMGARIVTVVDAYVAMTSDRKHRQALAPEQALGELILHAGRQFDPEVVEVFQGVLDKRLSVRDSDRKPKVLIIDSQEDFRRVLKIRMLNEAYEVNEASDYDRGLESILKDPPDLILTDVDASKSEAFQLLQELREDDVLKRLPVIFLSQKLDRLSRVRALREGVDDFLVKEDDIDELLARVDNVLTREAIRSEKGTRLARRGITGNLEDLALPDIIQTLVIGMKTASISVDSHEGKGQMWFENGTPRHAKTGRQQGDQAFYEMVRWTGGQFVIEHGVTSKKVTLKQDAMFLLMEGLRLMDEESSDAAPAAS